MSDHTYTSILLLECYHQIHMQQQCKALERDECSSNAPLSFNSFSMEIFGWKWQKRHVDLPYAHCTHITRTHTKMCSQQLPTIINKNIRFKIHSFHHFPSSKRNEREKTSNRNQKGDWVQKFAIVSFDVNSKVLSVLMTRSHTQHCQSQHSILSLTQNVSKAQLH